MYNPWLTSKYHLFQNYRGNQASTFASQISGKMDEQFRHCLSDVSFEFSVFADVIESLIDAMTSKSTKTRKLTIVECCECSTDLSFFANIVRASHYYKLQLPNGLREFESSQNAHLQAPRSIWSLRFILQDFAGAHSTLDSDSIFEDNIFNTPIEIQLTFVLFHVFSFDDTQLDKHDIENPMITIAEIKKTTLPECITDKRLYIMRFLAVILADQFDVFTENLRLLNIRPAFIDDFGQMHTQCFLSILKRQSFSENATLVSLIRRLFVTNFDSPHFGLLTSFLLGSSSFLSFVALNSSLKLPDIDSGNTQLENSPQSFADIWNEYSALYISHTSIYCFLFFSFYNA